MDGISLPELLTYIFGYTLAFALIFGPAIIAAASNKVRGAHKAVWVLISLVFSWLGLALFYLLSIKNIKK